MILQSFIALVIMALAHIFTHRLRFSQFPRSKWLSVAGGISVAYIFLAAFPELNEFQGHLEEFEILGLEGIHIYIVSLLGLIFFYGLEHHARKSEQSGREPREGEKEEKEMYWIHLGSFAFYNFTIGYLLLERESDSIYGFILYALAMAFHFMVTDNSLQEHYKKRYQRQGRWLLVGVLLLGWGLSLLVHIPEIWVGIMFAFLSGGIIMNVLKEELPKERESNLPSFIAGVVGYSVLLVYIA